MEFKITDYQISKLNIDFSQAKSTDKMTDMSLSFNIKVPENKNKNKCKIIIEVSFSIDGKQIFLMQENIEIELNKTFENMNSKALAEYIKNTCFEEAYKIFRESYVQLLKDLHINYIDLPTFDEIKSKF